MSDAIIQVEGLGKKYRIRHQQQGRRYVALRDVLAQKFAAPFKFLRKTTGPRDHATTSPVVRGQLSRSPSSEDFWALKDVSFEVKRGEVVGIIGRNGAGKSTLLKILSRITEPTTGEVRLRGRVASLLEVGTGFHPELTGRENIFLNGAILGMSKAEIKRKFDEIVAFAEVEKFLDTPVKRYSSGMYVRLAFAVAAHLEPEILIVDEVLAVGDAQFQKKCLGKMEEVSKGGRTVLFVSHNMAALLNLCPRSILLDSGKVQNDGNSQGVVASYMQRASESGEFRRNGNYGDGRVRVKNVEIITAEIRSGSDFECVVTLERSKDCLANCPVEISLDFSTGSGAAVLQLFSKHLGREFFLDQRENKLKVRLDSLPLVPGRYQLTVWVGSGRTTFDAIVNCYEITVNDGFIVKDAFIENRGTPVIAPGLWTQS